MAAKIFEIIGNLICRSGGLNHGNPDLNLHQERPVIEGLNATQRPGSWRGFADKFLPHKSRRADQTHGLQSHK
jgi:hypothetical protein